MSLPSTSCCCDEQEDAQAVETTTGITTMTYSSKPPHNQSAGKNRFPGRTASSDHCWKHQFTGQCTHGPGCRYKHVGEAGCYKSEVADGHGRCLMEIEPGGCKRKNCPFLHREEAEPQNRNTMMYLMLPRQLTNGQSGSDAFSVQLYHLGINTCPAY